MIWGCNVLFQVANKRLAKDKTASLYAAIILQRNITCAQFMCKFLKASELVYFFEELLTSLDSIIPQRLAAR